MKRTSKVERNERGESKWIEKGRQEGGQRERERVSEGEREKVHSRCFLCIRVWVNKPAGPTE